MASANNPLPRVFIDSSILMAGSLSSTGSARDLLMMGARGEVELVASPLVLQETERNLYKKAPAGLAPFWELRELFDEHLVDPPENLVAEVSQHIEPKDAAIVAGAVAAGTVYLVTYDRRHLLGHAEMIHRLYGLAVVTPDEAIAALTGDGRDNPP